MSQPSPNRQADVGVLTKKVMRNAQNYLNKTIKRVEQETKHKFTRTSCDECDLCCEIPASAQHPETAAYSACEFFGTCEDGKKGCVQHGPAKPLKCQNFHCGYRMGLTDTHPKDSGFYIELTGDYQDLRDSVGATKTSVMVVQFKDKLPTSKSKATAALKKLNLLSQSFAIMGSLVVWKSKTEIVMYGPQRLDGVRMSRPENES